MALTLVGTWGYRERMAGLRQGLAPCGGPLTRREMLRVGALGCLGLTLPNLLRAQAQAATGSSKTSSSFGRAKSCILLYLSGGPPQHETFDPKPEAPLEIRGDFKSI